MIITLFPRFTYFCISIMINNNSLMLFPIIISSESDSSQWLGTLLGLFFTTCSSFFIGGGGGRSFARFVIHAKQRDAIIFEIPRPQPSHFTIFQYFTDILGTIPTPKSASFVFLGIFSKYLSICLITAIYINST